jgi:hypothetical protein
MSLVDVRTAQPHALAGTMVAWLTWSASAEIVAYYLALDESATLRHHFRHADG